MTYTHIIVAFFGEERGELSPKVIKNKSKRLNPIKRECVGNNHSQLDEIINRQCG